MQGQIERHQGIAERLAECIEDPRDAKAIQHSLAEMIRFRTLLIAAGYADGNDCNALRIVCPSPVIFLVLIGGIETPFPATGVS
jgi:hypothetical protein